jgi:catechol 2,3-dioxygenase-like lactoylglutathione lyase family enzyme
MIDHVSIKVRDYAKAKKFFEAALKPLGYSLLKEYPEVGGFGKDGKPDFWISTGTVLAPTHIAFRGTRKEVDAFHAAALAAGAKDEGKPGVREMYHPNYYGAFVIDHDGNNIEAVCHE